MKIYNSDYKKGFFEINVENNDDLWYLSQVISPGDKLSAKTLRKLKIGDGENVKVVRKYVYLEIEAEKIEFNKSSYELRVLGKIVTAADNVPLGQYHTISIEEGLSFKLNKKILYQYQIKRLKEAMQNVEHKILIAAFDRGEAIIAQIKKYGFEILTSITGDVNKKYADEKINGDFFEDSIKILFDLAITKNCSQVVLATPNVWITKLKEIVKKISPKNILVIYATCVGTGENVINEILKRPEVQSALKTERVSKELGVVESLLANISKGLKYSYGFDDVLEKANIGSVKTLLVSDGFINKKEEENSFDSFENLLSVVEKSKGDIMIVSSDNEAGEKLDGLGGVAALLRYDY